MRTSGRWFAAAAVLFVACAWQANRRVCPACEHTEVWLVEPDDAALHARLYWPLMEGSEPHLVPVVVVCPGYLANLAWMEIPWAAVLTRIGAAALFLDRRGQGLSGGALWPSPPGHRLDDFAPDVRLAVDYVRSLAPLVDPDRIALLGHSDGATAALMAASADWEIRATVAASASVAPWEFVNHVAPQNLLLIYGDEDRFILDGTDTALIRSATRGVLDGAGEVGQSADGSRRRLLRVPGYGHLNVLGSAETLEATSAWLKSALGLDGTIQTARPASLLSMNPGRGLWVALGLVAMASMIVLRPFRNRSIGAARDPVLGLRVLLVATAWLISVAAAASLIDPLRSRFPAQEGAVVFLLLLLPGAGLSIVFLVSAWFGVGHRVFWNDPNAMWNAADLGRAALWSAILFALTHALLLHHYEVWLTPPRALLAVLFAASALVAFAALDAGVAWASLHHQRASACVFSLGLATSTSIAAPYWFERMSVLPVYLYCVTLVVTALYRIGALRRIESVVFGALTLGWLEATVCGLY